MSNRKVNQNQPKKKNWEIMRISPGSRELITENISSFFPFISIILPLLIYMLRPHSFLTSKPENFREKERKKEKSENSEEKFDSVLEKRLA